MAVLKSWKKLKKEVSANKAVCKGLNQHGKLSEEISLIAFACEAGMGSSLMGANILKNNLKEAGFDIPVKHFAVNQVPENADVVFTQENLAANVKKTSTKCSNSNSKPIP